MRSEGQNLEKLFSQNVNVGNNLQWGDNVKDQSNASLFEGTVVEDGAFLGPSCVLTNVTAPVLGSSDMASTSEPFSRVGRIHFLTEHSGTLR